MKYSTKSILFIIITFFSFQILNAQTKSSSNDENKKAKISGSPIFGCIACGHCMAVCPAGAIEISGRELSKDDLFDLPLRKDAANYEQLYALFSRRRSIREFQDKDIEREIIQKILDVAVTSPMGLPPFGCKCANTRQQRKNKEICS